MYTKGEMINYKPHLTILRFLFVKYPIIICAYSFGLFFYMHLFGDIKAKEQSLFSVMY
jgi:hypothetical protein